MSNIPDFSVSDLLNAGVHFGHKTSRWNPSMAPYIHSVRNGVHILDLNKTAALLKFALSKIYDAAKNKKKILIVGSKSYASDLVAEYAEKSGQFYVNNRWLGGTLTNWKTVSSSIRKLDDIEKIISDEKIRERYTKKELLNFENHRQKLLKFFIGIRKMQSLPDLLIVIDSNKEHLAIKEAVKLGIPIVAVLDTNSNPTHIDYVIPGNDDAIKSIKLYCQLFAEAVLRGIQDTLTDAGVDIGEGHSLVTGEDNSESNKIYKKLNKNRNKLSDDVITKNVIQSSVVDSE
ncbi:30S ribosomal protein S2 [Rickettsia endosymbiont of Cardiosporidium cionae]|uniref:30S ribosomal protein S2 n=1 Tax=Rickettsia endosymbiont of Cardiosporidium cionae TaxID=2777155 RepID=UPI001895D6A5|nr:30S ribosomal protein S2 [Rickettsia endosymbiont of Cardiosporidium cionae]KAF8818255.1 30S ribosomal protein S2 [Rickettsia endosymbiont of Cardiosporidium cionae]